MNKEVYIVTGAYGHLGSTIVKELSRRGCAVRGLIIPGELPDEPEHMHMETVTGDIRDSASLRPLFEHLENREIIVIHTAGIVDIKSKLSNLAYQVNVEGTKNIVQLALEYKVKKFIHVSSVHAIAEHDDYSLITETLTFDSALVDGSYAKTKAEASAYILEQVACNKLPAVIVQPSGILGPYDTGKNNLVHTVLSYIRGKLPLVPKGGYDLVDVRDVASACIAAVHKGRIGQTYILANQYYHFKEIFFMLHRISGAKKIVGTISPTILKPFAKFSEYIAQKQKKNPLITPYSLAVIHAKVRFSHEKASRELGFWPRDLYQTLSDTVSWLSTKGLTKRKKEKKVRQKKILQLQPKPAH